MSQIASPKPFTTKLVQTGALIVAVLLGFYTALISQVSSPDYRGLFWSSLPVALVHFTLALGYIICVRHCTRWIVLCFAIVVLAFYGEMTLRVWR
jgi:hypothetical protein